MKRYRARSAVNDNDDGVSLSFKCELIMAK